MILDSGEPQVVFLDIQLRGETGFDLIDDINPKTRIIFVTAHDEYAVQAFKVNALDYIMKPIDEADLKRSIEKMRQNVPQPDFLNFKFRDQIVINLDKKRVSFSPDDLIAIKAGENHIYDLYFEHKKVYFRRSIKEWMDVLGTENFMPIHRNTLINKKKIQDILEGGALVKMKNVDSPFEVSRSHLQEVRDIPTSI